VSPEGKSTEVKRELFGTLEDDAPYSQGNSVRKMWKQV
jgi:hypothetical protein